MEERYLVVLTEIVSNPMITRKELEKKLGLSRDQIKYAIKKINDYLQEKEFPSIQRTRNGCFVVDPTVSKLLVNSEQIEQMKKDIFYSEEERIIILILLFLNESLDLSLEFFVYELKVSKNTILRDLAKLKERLASYSLKIDYSRTQGYSISGNELIIRDFLKETLFNTIKMSTGLQLLSKFSGVENLEKKGYETKLKALEEKLEIRFTDEQYRFLPYFLAIIFQRISYGKMVKNKNPEKEDDVLLLDETKVIEELLNLTQLDSREKIYISLQILSSNIISADFLNDTTTSELKKVLIQCIDNFEMKTLIDFKDKEKILNSLMYHLTPAYYRIKYRINEKNEIYEKEFFDHILMQYDYLNSIIRDCFKPLEEYLEVPLPDVEIMYISLIFGSKILPQGRSDYPKLKTAIVICPKGVTYSQLMLSQLMELFPEVYFYEPVSHRAFKESNLKVDIIFSIGHFHDYENCFVVKATMSEKEKQQLRSNVTTKLFGFEHQYNLLEQIMNVINPFVQKGNRKIIEEQMTRLLSQNHLSKSSENTLSQKSNKRLYDFLSESRIRILNSVSDFEEAIRIVAQPLIYEDAITENYVDKVIESHDFDDPYIVLGDQLAIPHADPKDGVNKISISLLIVREGVMFSDDQRINIIFLLAPIDNKQHNQAIIDILSIAESQEWINQLILSNTQKQILDILKQVSV